MPSTILDALNIKNTIECLHLKSSHSFEKITMSTGFDIGFGTRHSEGMKEGVAWRSQRRTLNKCHCHVGSLVPLPLSAGGHRIW